ncbi:hypothetical protein KSP40_PGU011314 [Platanthera guangdongensis]|uniref:Uncharacterized protein n=1 Tax=Platanthera guangdongensis TaxID=2320717 RepID=A0ABR2MH52_9ASPA
MFLVSVARSSRYTRSGASSGILIATVTLPSLMLSRLIQVSRAVSDHEIGPEYWYVIMNLAWLFCYGLATVILMKHIVRTFPSSASIGNSTPPLLFSSTIDPEIAILLAELLLSELFSFYDYTIPGLVKLFSYPVLNTSGLNSLDSIRLLMFWNGSYKNWIYNTYSSGWLLAWLEMENGDAAATGVCGPAVEGGCTGRKRETKDFCGELAANFYWLPPIVNEFLVDLLIYEEE